MIKGRPERILRSMTLKIIPNAYSEFRSTPRSSNSFNAVFTEDLHFEKLASLAKTLETGSIEASTLTPSCIHISLFCCL